MRGCGLSGFGEELRVKLFEMRREVGQIFRG